MTSLRLTHEPAHTIAADALVIGVVKVGSGDDQRVELAGADEVAAAFEGTLPEALAALGARGVAGEVTKLPTLGRIGSPVLVAAGLGPAPSAAAAPGTADVGSAYDGEVLRRAAGAAVRGLAGCRSVALALPAGDVAAAGAVAEGALLGAYAFTRYRSASRDQHKPPVEELHVITPAAGGEAADAAEAVARRAGHVVRAVHLARDLVNTPPRDLPPAVLADAAVSAAREAGLEVEVLDEEQLRSGGYGGVIGVGQGSANPPRLVKISYRPDGADKHLALVGKGITFDSGGLSLKTSTGMEWMKADMGGAAAVVAAVTAIARLEVPVNVTVWAPMAENMPSGAAQRPSDVLTAFGGKTIEVLNTDAEGRLILADALAAASEESPDLIIDAATLTGAQLVALGSRTAAIMANDDALRDRLYEVATGAGEAMWPMPLPEELRKSLDSEVADIANMGDRYGGMLVAGLFLKDFVGEGLRWAHLDIAGPAFNDGQPYGYTPKGGTGAAVRTLVAAAEELAAGRL